MSIYNIANGLRVAVLLIVLAFIAVVFVLTALTSSSLLDVKLITTTEMVDKAHGIASEYHARARRGEMSEAEAQTAAAAEIGAIRYSGNEYLWVNDMGPTMVMHPTKPSLNGQDISNNQDPNGKRLFVEMVEVVAKDGEGLVDYMWPKPGSEEPVSKTSYVKGFTPWGWVIGSGVYIDDVQAIARGNSLVALAMVALVGLLAAGGVEFYVRYFRRRIDAMREAMHAVALGDLRGDIDPGHPDEIGLALQEIANMQASLIALVSQVKAPIASIQSAAGEVSRGGLDLSRRTEQTAANLEETSSAMTEFTSLVQQLAQTASESESIANAATNSAQQGSQDMHTAAATIEEIDNASSKISAIIKIIDGVAFQTNLLALNASVEAARAGDHGRGFNVVAEEVRKLAQEAAASAQDIKALIEDSASRVADGVSQIHRVRGSMDTILDSVGNVAQRATEITHASREQATGISEVSTAVSQLDHLTQQNAALAEQSSAAAEELLQQAQKLTEVISVFQLPTAHGQLALQSLREGEN